MIWSLGSMIGLFLPFIGTAICQAMTTIASNIVGSGEFQLLRRVTLSGITLISMIVGVMAIPMLLFPEQTFHLLFSSIDLAETSLKKVFLGLWLSFTFGTFTFLPLSWILAFQDTKYLLLTGTCCWVSMYLIMFLAVNVINIAADQCWIVLGFSNLIDLLLVWWSANRLTIQKKTVAKLMPSRL